MSLIDQDLSRLTAPQVRSLYTDAKLVPSASQNTLADVVQGSATTKPILVQLVDIENVTKSRLSRLDEILGVINPNDLRTDKLGNKGARRKIIRDVDVDDHEDSPSTAPNYGSGYYKLTLMDYKGGMVFGAELSKLSFLSSSSSLLLPIPLGSKIIVKPGTPVVRGMLLLKNELTVLVGGSFGEPKGLEAVMIRKLKAQLEELNESE